MVMGAAASGQEMATSMAASTTDRARAEPTPPLAPGGMENGLINGVVEEDEADGTSVASLSEVDCLLGMEAEAE